MDGRLARPRFDAVRGNAESSVECVESVVRLLLSGVGLRLTDPRVRVLRREMQELLVVLRVVRREGGDLAVRYNRLLFPARG